MEKNFNDFLNNKFPESSLDEWIARINKDLRSGDYDSLISHYPDGIDVQPAYTGEGLRTVNQDFRTEKYWGVIEEIAVESESQANRGALNALERGATGLLFYLQGNENLTKILTDIEIQYIRLRLVVQDNPDQLARQLNDLIAARSLNAGDLDIFINHDPLENLARTGNWFNSESGDFEILKALEQHAGAGINYRSINVNLFANAGATPAQQLGISLSMIYDTHLRLGAGNLSNYWVNFAIGSNYFMEIAKLRAFRRIWTQLVNELNVQATVPVIYAETAVRNKSIKDVYNNMIRTTAEAMASVIGGADEILVRSFDDTLGEPTEFGDRVARNQQHILQYESHLSEVQDMSAGSYFLERLTEELAEKGWEYFKTIEEQGGFIAAIQSSWLQSEIEASDREERAQYSGEEKFMVGVNKFTREDKDLARLLTRPMFSSANNKEHEVRPVFIKRLAEDFEQEFRNI